MEEETVVDSHSEENLQPEIYKEEELSALLDFVELIKKDESRATLACWGDHHDYSHGY